MKKIIIILTVTLVCLTTANGQNNYKLPTKGYSGDAGLSFGATIATSGLVPMGNIFTTHGYQFNSRVFLGVGLGSLNTQFLALYGSFTGTLRRPTETKPTYPYITVNVGYGISTWAGQHIADQESVYIEPRFGWSFYSKAGNLRYNTFISAALFNFKLIPQIGVAFQF